MTISNNILTQVPLMVGDAAATDAIPKLTLSLDMNVLNHLGIGLYSSTPAVVTEMIANAWDADATLVDIKIDSTKDEITIIDNGHGMDFNDIQTKFLRVGYARRDDPNGKGHFTASGTRRVMGRKGIGKLAMFSLGQIIDVYSIKQGENPIGGRVDVKKLQQSIASGMTTPYQLESLPADVVLPHTTGTIIVLRSLNAQTNKTEAYLRPRLARRFSILDPKNSFEVHLNNKPIVKEDRGFYKDVQFFWTFDSKTSDELKVLCTTLHKFDNNECIEFVDPQLASTLPYCILSGYIATVDQPKKLKALDSNINEISIFANGRVFQEDMLGELGNSKIFNSYIVGEIHADFLDSDDTDRATASREAIKRDDPLVVALRAKLSTVLKQIEDKWDEWRREIGYINQPDSIPAITEWLETLTDSRDKKLANKLLTSIANTQLNNNEEADAKQKKELYKSTIVSFEKLKSRNLLDKLDSVTSVLSPEFNSIFTSLSDVEETMFHDITSSRLEVIKGFKNIVDAQSLEKVAQRYLFDNLWLLDPSWDRVSGNAQMEVDLTAYLKTVPFEHDSGARLDITYKATTGRHKIIELKRPGLTSLDPYALLKQAKKYHDATTSYYKSHPDVLGVIPAIDIFLILEKDAFLDEQFIGMLREVNTRVLTYKGLIANAEKSYAEYLKLHTSASRIDTILSKI